MHIYIYIYIYIYRVRQKSIPYRNCNIMTTVRYFCTIFVWLIEEIFAHVSTKFYGKILKTSKVMNFLRRISKFQINQAYFNGNTLYSKVLFFIQINQAYETGIYLRNV